MHQTRARFASLSSPDDEVLPGVAYGRPEWVPSPAYWAVLAQQQASNAEAYVSPPGTPLIEDVAFCLLGGYGIKMELNRAAWEHLKAAGVFERNAEFTAEDIEQLLLEPLNVGNRHMKYRFPRQRASRLFVALQRVRNDDFENDDAHQLRDALMGLPGIGPKTASWIVRNWTGSDEVAILDVHVIRAGRIMGLFPERVRLPDDYEQLERRFLDFAQAMNIRASFLDALIWREMRALTR